MKELFSYLSHRPQSLTCDPLLIRFLPAWHDTTELELSGKPGRVSSFSSFYLGGQKKNARWGSWQFSFWVSQLDQAMSVSSPG